MRLTWPTYGFPVTVTHLPWRADGACLSDHDLYDQAKEAGDVGAALQIVEDLVNWESVDLIVDFWRNRAQKPLVVAPSKASAERTNALAPAYAAWLANELGFERCDTIYQYRGVKRDFKDAWHRIANPSELYGEVISGRDFIIADDVCTLGGTIAETRSFIERCGGRVIGSTCLASGAGGHVQLGLSRQTHYGLRTKFGGELDELWNEEFSYGTACLTEPEGKFLLRQQAGVGRIRDAIHRARDKGNVRDPGRQTDGET